LTTIVLVKHAERAARNESVFRELNEQLDAAAAGLPADVRGFVCECSNIACTAVVAVRVVEYEEVRQHPDRFIVAPDARHVDPSIEDVVRRGDDYWIVQKRGEAGAIAEQLDPNS
jgi:hypothetical protein